MAGRCRRRGGGECESGVKRVLVEKLFVWTAGALIPPPVVVVKGRNVAPEEAREEESDGGHWWEGLHHRLGVGACTQKDYMPKARAGEGEMSNAPSTRASRPHQARRLCCFFLLLMFSVLAWFLLI